MELENIFTRGTEGINVAGDPQRSLLNFPSNEDHAMIVKIENISGGVVSGVKIWDVGSGKIFYARLEYLGRPGTPPDNSLSIGQQVIFHRVGDFNSQGTADYEKHEEDPLNCSFVCFVAIGNPVIMIEDQGGGEGKEIYYDNFGVKQYPANSETLEIVVLDPLERYQNSMPPQAEGRIYRGQKIFGNPNYYLIFLPGRGEKETTLVGEEGHYIYNVDVDGSGHVLDAVGEIFLNWDWLTEQVT